MFDFSLFFNTRYLFDTLPNTDFLLGFPLLVFFGVLLFVHSILKSKIHADKHFRKSVKKKLWKFPYLGGIGLVLVLARFGEVPVFSMRAVLYGFVLFSLIVCIVTVQSTLKSYRERLASAQREREKKAF